MAQPISQFKQEWKATEEALGDVQDAHRTAKKRLTAMYALQRRVWRLNAKMGRLREKLSGLKFEQDNLATAYDKHRTVKGIAKELGISTRMVDALLERHGIDPPRKAKKKAAAV